MDVSNAAVTLSMSDTIVSQEASVAALRSASSVLKPSSAPDASERVYASLVGMASVPEAIAAA